jgi:hypothetical protein
LPLFFLYLRIGSPDTQTLRRAICITRTERSTWFA